ncbi:MAG: glycerol-3-phosphate dehydrogenase/oxidase [Oceanococcaceae bacterium]
MQRNFGALDSRDVDVLVIGGGIYGAWTACSAALKGWSVALVEQGDWASGTSSASSKLIHGGLRYLEHFEFSLVRHALEERRTLSRIAPHLVDPVAFTIPIYAGDRVGRAKMKAGLTLYDQLAGGNQPTPGHASYSSTELIQRLPYLKAEDLKGGFTYGDCQEDDARVTLEAVRAANAAGATVCNYAKAEPIVERGRTTGAAVIDQLDGRRTTVRARLTVVACGPWSMTLLGGRGPKAKLIKGVHLMLPPLPEPRGAFLLTARSDGRVFFVIPWYDQTIVGTTESEYRGDPELAPILESEVQYLLSEANRALPGLGWTRESVNGAWVGVRTLMEEEAGSLSAVSREFSVHCPMPGALVPMGGKFTTARRDAEEILAAAARQLGKPPRPQATDRPLPRTPDGDFADWHQTIQQRGRRLGLGERNAYWVGKRYGRDAARVLDLIDQRPELAQSLGDLPFCKAEALYAAQDEMVIQLKDLVRRRIPLMLMMPPNEPLLTELAQLIAPVRGWSEADCQRQVQRTLARWPRIIADADATASAQR